MYVPTSISELNTFLGINLLMGLKHSPSYKDYWSSGPDLKDHYVSSLMSVKRFSWLLSHVHINDNSAMPDRGSPNFDKLYKVRPLIDLLLRNFQRCLLPSQQVAIDESMIKFKGRSSLKQYMPKKPVKRGYKVWMLCDKSGYCLKFDIYTGKTSSPEKALGVRVITHLTVDLRNKDHILYFDNFFNSVPLMEELKKQNIHAVGTLNLQRKYLPTFKADKIMKRGDMQWFTSNTGLAVIKCKDNRSLHILSNYHDPENVCEVQRKEKDGTIKPVTCPAAVIDYNHNMNFVDKFDQLLASYKTDRRSKKWWHRIMFYLLDAAVVNSYCIYKLLQLPPMSSKDFRRQVINSLVAEKLVSHKRSSSQSIVPVQIKKSKPFVPAEVRHQSSKHQPERSTRRRCALCSSKVKQCALTGFVQFARYLCV
nr:piggyBac transposable element-derived protein 4-like [Leptinotarsa decemlineata]